MSDNLNTIGIRGKIAARTPDYRYTLPEGGNPGDIPVKTETGVEWQQPEPATTTPDYNQNDETASDYIKNRPCYINELPSVYSMLYKISDDIPESLLDSSKNLYMTVTSGLNIYRGLAQRIQQNDTITLVYQVAVIIALSDGATYTEEGTTITFPTRGVYFTKASGDMDVYVSEISASEDGGNSILSWDGATAKIKMLDHRMIGNPDWNESDETARGYIKNRIVYIGDEYAASFESDSTTIRVGTNYVAYAGDMAPFIANRTYHIAGSISGCVTSSGGKNFAPVNIDMIASCTKDSYLPIEVSSYPVNGYYYRLTGIYDKSLNSYKGKIELSNAKGISNSFALKISLTVTEIKQLDSLLLPTITADKLADGVLPSDSKLLPTVTASDSGKFLRVSSTGAWEAKTTTIPTQVQSDYDENSSSSKAYIKNRPCWHTPEVTETTVVSSGTFGMTGVTFGSDMPDSFKAALTYGYTGYAKFELLIGSPVGSVYLGEFPQGEDSVNVAGTKSRTYASSDGGKMLISSSEIMLMDSSILATVMNQPYELHMTTKTQTWYPLDERYIPSTIARKSEVPDLSSVTTNPVFTGSFSQNRKASTAVGTNSHAEGVDATASGQASHAEGDNATASGRSSHAEGRYTTASADQAHAEGANTVANKTAAHAEGNRSTASGMNAHAEGAATTASGLNSHAEGEGTKASSSHQHVQGKYNVADTSGVYAHIVGNGALNSESNAHTLDWNGNAWYAGTVEGTAMIIKSSTEGSTKRFKITVDDSGTLTATEIVETVG